MKQYVIAGKVQVNMLSDRYLRVNQAKYRLKSAQTFSKAREKVFQFYNDASQKERLEDLVAQAKAQLDLATQQSNRMEKLWEQGYMSSQDRDQADASFDVALARLKKAQAALDAYKKDHPEGSINSRSLDKPAGG